MSKKGGRSALTVRSLDFLKEDNTKLHHTSDFLTEALVVRRGQSFKIRLHLNRELNPKDQVVIQLSSGNRPLQAKGTLIFIPLPQTSEGPWSGTITDSSQNQCEIELRAPPTAIVGKYSFMLKIGDDFTYRPEPSHFYLLFNPWCKDDNVYMPNEKELDEYVLNDAGYIYVGHYADIGSRPWNFGQFEEGVLETCIALLDKGKLGQTARADPVKVSRAMSALVNSNDDRGVLIGNWSGKYPPETSPNKWTGSSSILLQYGQQNFTPVKFGQCWVFSGVLTTVMRCLGIPARSVTNFCSAHDTEGNLTIDVYINKKGEHLDNMTSDSIWNFHVWNDVWMKRPELPEGYDGWQAVDATPQEMSGGVYQCGPCPLRAIKHGDVHLPHDTGFVFAEVNANRVLWMVEGPDKPATKVREQWDVVGQNISTKALGQDQREDITELYKFPEGSIEERKALKKASAIVSAAGPAPEPGSVQVGITSSAPARLGSPVIFSISLSNQLPRSVTFTLTAAAQLQNYNGKANYTVKSLKQEITIEAGKSTTVPVQIEASEYLSELSAVDDILLLLFTAMVECDDPYFVRIEVITVAFEYPTMTVDLPPFAKLGEQFTGTFTFKNTTGVPMEDCKLIAEGLGLLKLTSIDGGNLPVDGIFSSKILCTPYRTGRRMIIARITSKQICGISADASVNIE